MNTKFIIGRYFPGNSLIHRIDPRAKIAAGFYFVFVLILANTWPAYVAFTLFTAIIIKLTGIPFKIYFKGLKPLLNLILFTVFLQMIFSGGRNVWFQLGPITISEAGVINGIFVFIRFTLTVFMTTAISLTTRAIDLTDAMASLLKPLKFFKVPVQDIALMLSIALRFIPTLMDEIQRIMNAQRARGVEFGEGNVFEQMKKMVPLFLPLFVNSFYRAEDLANTLDVRGYQGHKRRTRIKVQKWHSRDTIFLTSYAVLTGFIIFFR